MKNKNYMMYRYLLCVNDSFDLNFSQAETVLLSIARKKKIGNLIYGISHQLGE